MSVKESLRGYKPPAADQSGAQACIATPIATNPYFQVEQQLLWPESVLPSYGETCRRAIFVNGYHVLLCRRRVFVVQEGQFFSFPPFDFFVLDVYVEKLDKAHLLVVVAHEGGVHVGRMRCGSTSEVLDESLVPTSTPVARIHRLRRSLFCLCFSDGTVQNMVVEAESGGGGLFADLLPAPHSWLSTAASLLLPARRREYLESFFDNPNSRLVVLTDRDVTVWVYQTDGYPERPAGSLRVPEGTATVVPPMDHEVHSIGTLILRNGTRVPLHFQPTGGGGVAKMSAGPEEHLPSGLASLATVSAARGEANALVFYDDVTASVVVVAGDSHTPLEAAMASQFNLPLKLRGIGFDGRGEDSRNSGTFWLYTDGPLAFRVGRVSMGTRLQQQFARSRSEAISLLQRLPTSQRVSLCLEAACIGLPLGDVEAIIDPLLQPILLDEATMSLSPGAEGMVHFLMDVLEKLDQLCAPVPYWELSTDLDQARRHAAECCELLQSYLSQRGWLDSAGAFPAGKVHWIKFHAVSPTALNATTARHTQAYYLGTLLSLVQHASTIAWLYSLLLEAGAGAKFVPTLKESLWGSENVTDVESRYVMELLACRTNAFTQRLLDEDALLPRKAQLAVRFAALVQEGDCPGALRFAGEHISDCIQYDLFDFVTKALEGRAPELLPRINLLLQQYHVDPATSSEILSLLKGLPWQGGDLQSVSLMKRHIRSIFDDTAAPDLHGVVLDWMEGHALDDPWTEVFADVIAGLEGDVNLSHTLTGTFFTCWREEVRGSVDVAARNFGRLARTALEAPLSARLVCVQHARRCDPDDEDKHTEFILLLQNQLAELLAEHAMAAGRARLVAPQEQIQLDRHALTQQFLDESALFEVAGRYHELGGASIQLDILKIHNDAPEEVTSEALLAMLTFLQAAGRTAAEAVEMVLREYLHNFETTLPLSPFVMFLAFGSTAVGDVVKILLGCGVSARAVFESLLSLVDTHSHETLFPVCDIMQALTDVVDHVDVSHQGMCVSYLAECIRGLLAGEYRSLSLTQSDVFSLKAMSATLERRLRATR